MAEPLTPDLSPDNPPTDFESHLTSILAPALKVALYLCRSREDAEDLVQEAALQAFRAFDSFEVGTNFKAWFLRVQHNCFLARHRAQSRRPQTVAIEDDEALDTLYLFDQTRSAGMHKNEGDPAGAFLSRLDGAQIADALRALPPEYRVVATLYFVEELSYEQIAQVVECPLNTVRSRLHRSRRLLQHALWELAQERGLVAGVSQQSKKASDSKLARGPKGWLLLLLPLNTLMLPTSNARSSCGSRAGEATLGLPCHHVSHSNPGA